jgi:hypothetical protein
MFVIGAFVVVLIVVAAVGVLSILLRLAITRGATKVSDIFKPRPKPQAISVIGGGHGQHQTAFVSRHHLAEGGLQCPLCHTTIQAGDFTGVRDYVVDGRVNEGVVCQGEREVGDRVVACATILLASPDTEHGDHLGDDGQVDAKGEDPPAYYTFVRTSSLQALREKWGVDVDAADQQANTVDVADDRPQADREKTADTARLPVKE